MKIENMGKMGKGVIREDMHNIKEMSIQRKELIRFR